MTTDTNKTIRNDDPSFKLLQKGLGMILKALQQQGAPLGSTIKLRPVGMDLCCIVATGDSADVWEQLHDAYERGELTED